MTDPFAGVEDGSSLSGHERNVLFLSREGRQFKNVSGVSGADDPADGRAVSLLDYDRDGWQDLAVVNANSPLLQLFRNEIGEVDGQPRTPNVLALRFEGGNRSAQPADGLSSRDGYGARVEIDIPGATLVRVHRAGEGFAAQNSATLLVGLGEATGADAVRVRWPSGRTQELGPVAAGSLLTLLEAPGDGADHRVEPYRIEGLAQAAADRRSKRASEARVLAAANGARDTSAPLRLLTTMATWCDSCKGELPQVARLRRSFGPDEVALLGVPVDEDDDRAKLDAYEQEHRPAYTLLKELPEEQIEEVRRTVLEELRIDALPAAIATDARGRVLRTLWEVPSVSEVRELLAQVRS
jgi:hypothetical protein